ncbi:hypothetical protein Q8W71_14110 [Methylobacterium sp. NEAU 140]|uniref:hypothetical protein n=1 Tax=Methylobacterium sp. NEAU 140 TaxID=3064945 RepID=UPI0027356EAD|nr:hypothetical protein [Methylobacterium sp. NEAU 140]MDP4023766.1 hypothetical protein [Methylobacterium sp. NEAU 140]
MTLRLLLTLMLTCASGHTCWSQAAPANVNDCTLIQEPTELRNCILRSQGERQPLPTMIESSNPNAPPSPAGDGEKDRPAASKLRGPTEASDKRKIRLLKKPETVMSEHRDPVERPRPSISEVWVDQIVLPPKR